MIEAWFWTHELMFLSYVFAIVGVSHMLRQRRSPGSTVAWLLIFVSAPLFGSLIYLMFGGRKLRLDKKLHRRRGALNSNGVRTGEIDWRWIAKSYGAFSVRESNQVRLCYSGSHGLSQILELIRGAEKSVFLSTFIFEDGESGRQVLDGLIDRAKAGCRVKVLIDGVGSIETPTRFFEPLIEAGGEFAVFKPVIHFPYRAPTNLRNHRKILVVDGVSSFSGGINISDTEFFRDGESPIWKDVGLILQGDAAADLQMLFLRDWDFALGKEPSHQANLDYDESSKGGCDDIPSDRLSVQSAVQVMPTGPDTAKDSVYSFSLTAIHRANSRVWIVTPYFVPNDSLVEALIFACQRGVDVRILIPKKSNHFLSDLAGAAMLRDIQKAGGKILSYPLSMVHAKVMAIDHHFATVGSANFDMRSLFLNYELLQIVYSPLAIHEVTEWFENLQSKCDKGLPPAGFLGQLGEGMIRMFSPLF